MDKKKIIWAGLAAVLIIAFAVAFRYSKPDVNGIYFDRWTGRTCTTFTDQCFEKK